MTPTGIPATAEVGQLYEIDLRDYLDTFYDPWFGAAWGDNRYVNVGIPPGASNRQWPSWLTVSPDSLRYGENPVDPPRLNSNLILSGTPTEPGTYHVDVEFVQLVSPTSNTVHWDIVVPDPIPPTPYTVKLISDPAPTKIETSAGAVTLTAGSATILGGIVMHEPELSRERQILHRWTDAAGNTFDWSKPVTSDLTLTADWREHFTAAVKDNTATVTISPSLPTEYQTHQIGWGDNTIDKTVTATSAVSHLYAAPGDYTITVSSRTRDWDAWTSSSATVSVEQVTTVTYTVTFNPAGGSVVSSQTVEKGKIATEPAAPTRQGYEFAGWLKDGQRYDFSTPVTGNLYLSASWTPVQPGGDDKGDKDAPAETNILALALAAGAVIALLATFITRHPAALLLTIILALAAIALEVMP